MNTVSETAQDSPPEQAQTQPQMSLDEFQHQLQTQELFRNAFSAWINTPGVGNDDNESRYIAMMMKVYGKRAKERATKEIYKKAENKWRKLDNQMNKNAETDALVNKARQKKDYWYDRMKKMKDEVKSEEDVCYNLRIASGLSWEEKQKYLEKPTERKKMMETKLSAYLNMKLSAFLNSDQYRKWNSKSSEGKTAIKKARVSYKEMYTYDEYDSDALDQYSGEVYKADALLGDDELYYWDQHYEDYEQYDTPVEDYLNGHAVMKNGAGDYGYGGVVQRLQPHVRAHPAQGYVYQEIMLLMCIVALLVCAACTLLAGFGGAVMCFFFARRQKEQEQGNELTDV